MHGTVREDRLVAWPFQAWMVRVVVGDLVVSTRLASVLIEECGARPQAWLPGLDARVCPGGQACSLALQAWIVRLVVGDLIVSTRLASVLSRGVEPGHRPGYPVWMHGFARADRLVAWPFQAWMVRVVVGDLVVSTRLASVLIEECGARPQAWLPGLDARNCPDEQACRLAPQAWIVRLVVWDLIVSASIASVLIEGGGARPQAWLPGLDARNCPDEQACRLALQAWIVRVVVGDLVLSASIASVLS